MRIRLRQIWLIAKSVLLEAVRKKEIYVIVIISSILIGIVMSIDFFGLKGLVKFYREICLKVMSVASVITVIILSSRQLPREFSNRTIYPLLAKPVSRFTFMLGKLIGVLLAVIFSFGLFMAVFVIGTYYMGGAIPWGLFMQHIYLQILMMTILACLCFWLSLLMNLDAAITIGILLYFLGSTMMDITSYIYTFMGTIGKLLIKGLVWGIPQLPLFDLSEKTVHSEIWPVLSFKTMTQLTIYGLIFSVVYFMLAMLWFRRKPL